MISPRIRRIAFRAGEAGLFLVAAVVGRGEVTFGDAGDYLRFARGPAPWAWAAPSPPWRSEHDERGVLEPGGPGFLGRIPMGDDVRPLRPGHQHVLRGRRGSLGALGRLGGLRHHAPLRRFSGPRRPEFRFRQRRIHCSQRVFGVLRPAVSGGLVPGRPPSISAADRARQLGQRLRSRPLGLHPTLERPQFWFVDQQSQPSPDHPRLRSRHFSTLHPGGGRLPRAGEPLFVGAGRQQDRRPERLRGRRP